MTDQEISNMTREFLKTEMYIDYVNNFLTVACFAEYWGMTVEEATTLIEDERAK